MKPVLVMQLARFGDLIQSKRLMLGLEASGRPVHLLVDASLEALARMVYPFARVHALQAHSRPDPARLLGCLKELAGAGFHRVYNLNFSGMNLAAASLFDPALVRGYSLDKGQILRDPWAATAFRWSRRRRLGALNLVDFWAGFAQPMVPPQAVNPDAAPRGGGLGVVMAGRNSRRSLPPDVLAAIVPTLLPGLGKAQIFLLGTAGERAAARELASLLPARAAGLVCDLTGRTDWRELADTVAGLDRVLTPDTGIMHLAAHFGVPVTAAFLSSAWCHETGPYGRGHTVWQAMGECVPCLEAEPCPCGLACLEPFRSRAFLRWVSGTAKGDPVPGLTGYDTGFDELGVVCRPFAGPDPELAERARVRGFLARRLGVEAGQRDAPAPDLAESLVEDPDFMLDKPQALLEPL